MPFIYDFLRKNYYSHAHFCQKNVHSLKNTLFSRPYFVRKTSIFSKTLCSHVDFFKNFMKNPLLPCRYLEKKHINSVKALLYFWPKVNRMPFFLIFQVKRTAFMPIFCQKNVCSLKNTMLSFPYFVKKLTFS